MKGLHPNSTYEFRVFCKSADGGRSEPSEVSELVQLRPKAHGPPRGVPARPQAPEIMERVGDQVGGQFYVVFRDVGQALFEGDSGVTRWERPFFIERKV